MNDSSASASGRNFPVTLDTEVARLSAPEFKGKTVELWVFESPARRKAAAQVLKDRGVTAHIRSAYKPLVCAFLEELDVSKARRIIITYPVVKGFDPERFLLECYPVSDLVAGAIVEFVPATQSEPGPLIFYNIHIETANDQSYSQRVAAPCRVINRSFSAPVLSNCGWLRVNALHDNTPQTDLALETDLEQALDHIIDVFAQMPERGNGCFFDRAEIRVEAPVFDLALPVGDEQISTAEVMHEEIYFSVLELLNTRLGKSAADRTGEPGQIVPLVHQAEDRVQVNIITDPEKGPLPEVNGQKSWPADPATARIYPPSEMIKAQLDRLPGVPFGVRPRQGRPVWGRYVDGPGPGVLISAGQHANETSGIVGALRAAQILAAREDTRFAVSALNNPDGYALFRELCCEQPRHMHHAARYTASGGDLEYTRTRFEHEIRVRGQELTGAKLHLNLHGYPSHEWTRPFSGYVPEGFATWSIPKGFCLILRVHPRQRQLGEKILNAAVAALARDEAIMALNSTQLTRYNKHVSVPDFELRQNVPVFISEVMDELFPITIITEAPDETIYDEAFIAAHTAQMNVVLAAISAYQSEDRDMSVAQRKCE